MRFELPVRPVGSSMYELIAMQFKNQLLDRFLLTIRMAIYNIIFLYAGWNCELEDCVLLRDNLQLVILGDKLEHELRILDHNSNHANPPYAPASHNF